MKHLIFLSICATLFMSACGKAPEIIRGTITEADHSSQTITLKTEDREPSVFRVSEEALQIYSKGQTIEGAPNQVAGNAWLNRIWPAGEEERLEKESINYGLIQAYQKRSQFPRIDIGESIPDFAFYDQNAKLIRSREWAGDWRVISFIFTRCPMPEMCPATIARLKQLQQKLMSAGIQNVKIAAITMDPSHDTPSVLHAYANAMEAKGIHFLTGSPHAMRALNELMGLRVEPDSNIILRHTMMTALFSPNGELLHRDEGVTWSLDSIFNKILDSQ